ncbi:MAG: hypothetical protein AAB446_00705 [Patescibacteria group bacterium]
MSNKIYKISFAFLIATAPFFASAQYLHRTAGLLNDFSGIVSNILVPLVFTSALLFFFYGVAKYIWSAGDKEESKKIMIWGIVALFVMSSVWGIVYFIRGELGLTDDSNIPIPTLGDASSGGSIVNNSTDNSDFNVSEAEQYAPSTNPGGGAYQP